MTLSRDLPHLSDPKLLEKIDRLRELNIGQHVPLPQLVVVGDQSSGKSSVLESLTGIPFPRDQTLCTRHATQITSRRHDTESIKISIIPAPNASDEHRKQIGNFRLPEYTSVQFQEDFVEIMRKAHDKMGLRIDLSSGNGAVFSEDVLKVEIQGPEEDLLTIIDVPGIFHATTEGTTKEDMEMVKALVQNYIKDDRTIILAVLPSNVDIATQEILQLAEDYDKKGERTLGVLTKPDLVTETSAKAAVCDLVQGKRRSLTLGYYLVRNRGADSDPIGLPELEQLFRQQPWNQLPAERVGIQALKDQLRSLLRDISRREFPNLVGEVNRQLKDCKKELDSLGSPRQDEREQRSFLSQIAGQFQNCVRAALAADYNASTVFDKEELRLITQVVNITDVFSSDFHEGAHSRNFEGAKLLDELALSKEIVVDYNEDSDDEWKERPPESMTQTLRKLIKAARVDEITDREHADLGDIVVLPDETIRPSESVTKWISDIYLRSRGLDLGTFNANLISVAFAEQSREWEAITKVYMSRVIITLHRFIEAILCSVCPDEMARQKLWEEILDSLVDRYRLALAQVDLLIRVNQRKQPFTLNKRFNESLSKARGERITEMLYEKARKDTKQYGAVQHMINLCDIPNAVKAKGNVEYLQEEIHDILHAYYSLALDRYIDNIFQLGVDHHLLHGPESPLQVFTPDWVLNLEPEDLNRIAGESKSARKDRTRAQKKIHDLGHALRVLKAP